MGKRMELIPWAILIAGLLKAYLLPAIALITGIEFIHIPDWISTPGIGHGMTICMGILPMVGISIFYFKGENSKGENPG